MWVISLRKDPDAGKDWGQEEEEVREGEVVGWYHWLRHEFEQAPVDGEGQGSPVCCSPWGLKESDTNEQLNNKSINSYILETDFQILKMYLKITIINPLHVNITFYEK